MSKLSPWSGHLGHFLFLNFGDALLLEHFLTNLAIEDLSSLGDCFELSVLQGEFGQHDCFSLINWFKSLLVDEAKFLGSNARKDENLKLTFCH